MAVVESSFEEVCAEDTKQQHDHYRNHQQVAYLWHRVNQTLNRRFHPRVLREHSQWAQNPEQPKKSSTSSMPLKLKHLPNNTRTHYNKVHYVPLIS